MAELSSICCLFCPSCPGPPAWWGCLWGDVRKRGPHFLVVELAPGKPTPPEEIILLWEVAKLREGSAAISHTQGAHSVTSTFSSILSLFSQKLGQKGCVPACNKGWVMQLFGQVSLIWALCARHFAHGLQLPEVCAGLVHCQISCEQYMLMASWSARRSLDEWQYLPFWSLKFQPCTSQSTIAQSRWLVVGTLTAETEP